MSLTYLAELNVLDRFKFSWFANCPYSLFYFRIHIPRKLLLHSYFTQRKMFFKLLCAQLAFACLLGFASVKGIFVADSRISSAYFQALAFPFSLLQYSKLRYSTKTYLTGNYETEFSNDFAAQIVPNFQHRQTERTQQPQPQRITPKTIAEFVAAPSMTSLNTVHGFGKWPARTPSIVIVLTDGSAGVGTPVRYVAVHLVSANRN